MSNLHQALESLTWLPPRSTHRCLLSGHLIKDIKDITGRVQTFLFWLTESESLIKDQLHPETFWMLYKVFVAELTKMYFKAVMSFKVTPIPRLCVLMTSESLSLNNICRATQHFCLGLLLLFVDRWVWVKHWLTFMVNEVKQRGRNLLFK